MGAAALSAGTDGVTVTPPLVQGSCAQLWGPAQLLVEARGLDRYGQGALRPQGRAWVGTPLPTMTSLNVLVAPHRWRDLRLREDEGAGAVW